jgi:hypothetical protein
MTKHEGQKPGRIKWRASLRKRPAILDLILDDHQAENGHKFHNALSHGS